MEKQNEQPMAVFQSSTMPIKQEDTEASLLSKLEQRLVQTLEAKLEEKFPKKEIKRTEENITKSPMNNKIHVKHTISMNILGINSLNLGYSYHRTSCALKYAFLGSNVPVSSNDFEYNAQVKEYELESTLSKNSWTLHRGEDLIETLKNPTEGILIQLINRDEDDEVIGYCIIPLDELDSIVMNASATQQSP